MTTGTEKELIDQAREAVRSRDQGVSDANWKLGECATSWRALSDQHTDQALATELRCSRGAIWQARRVYERFGETRGRWPSLNWKHFLVVVARSNADELLNAATASSLSADQLGAQTKAAATGRDVFAVVRSAIDSCVKAFAGSVQQLERLADFLCEVEEAVRMQVEGLLRQPPTPP